jgi:small neutral amino acid transporter SnatA (MarC family)
VLGNAGAAVLIRVMGLILASLAIEMLVEALAAVRSLPVGRS